MINRIMVIYFLNLNLSLFVAFLLASSKLKRGQSVVFTQGEVHVGCSVHFFLWPVANGSPRASMFPCVTVRRSTLRSPPFLHAAVGQCALFSLRLWVAAPTLPSSSPACPALRSGCVAPFARSSRFITW